MLSSYAWTPRTIDTMMCVSYLQVCLCDNCQVSCFWSLRLLLLLLFLLLLLLRSSFTLKEREREREKRTTIVFVRLLLLIIFTASYATLLSNFMELRQKRLVIFTFLFRLCWICLDQIQTHRRTKKTTCTTHTILILQRVDFQLADLRNISKQSR